MSNTIASKIGIDETKRALDAAGSGLIGLKDINWGQVAKELADLDASESKQLMMVVVDTLLKLIGFAQEYKGIIRLLITILK